ncbi:hypothetical protein ACHWQZ_G016294 [Mnemiopsis leidyi]
MLVNSTSLQNPINMGISDQGYNVLLLYHSLATLVGLVGNSLVLYGSIKYNSLSIDSVSIVLLESLAALDIMVVLFFMSSIWLSMIAKRWVLGSVGCFIYGFLGYVCTTVEMQVVTVISLYRLFSLSAPFTARSFNKKHALVVVGVLVFITLVFQCCYHTVGAFYIFDTKLGSCEISVTAIPTPTTVIYLLTGVCYYIVTPAIILPISNIAILVIATIKSRSGRLPAKNALITVCCVTWVFVFSVTPVVVRIAFQTLDPFHPLPSWFMIMAQEFLFLNSILNPVIYTATNKSFRSFLIRLVVGRRGGEMVSYSDYAARSRAMNNTAVTTPNHPNETVLCCNGPCNAREIEVQVNENCEADDQTEL